MSLKLIMINWILQPSDFYISKININRQLELTICWHQSPLLWNKSPNCGRSCDCVSQSSSSVIGAGREQRGHGASVASLSIIRLCAAHTVLQRQRHIHVPTCHFPAPVWCGRQYYQAAMLCSSWLHGILWQWISICLVWVFCWKDIINGGDLMM